MNFRNIAIVTALIALILGIGCLFAGGLMVGRWDVEPTEGVLLMGRRIGSLYLGLSVIFFLARNADVSPARAALATGTVVALVLLASNGILDFAAGRAGSGILLSAAIEILLAASYIWILIRERQAILVG